MTPEGWREYKLGDLSDRITSGGTPLTANSEYYGGQIPWLKTQEIKFNRIYETETHITEEGLKNSSAKWIAENSIIVAMYGATAGKIAISKIPLTTNQACCNITLNPKKANFNFIYYNLLSRYSEILNMATGAAQQNLNSGMLKELNINMPDIQKQTQIASILSSLDDKIELNLQMNKTLEGIAQAIFKEWFVDFKFPGFNGELINGLPKGWRNDEFINHITAERGLSYKGSGLSDEGNGIPMNNLNSIYEGGGYKYEGIKYYNGEYKERHIARPGDIIVANTEQGHRYLLIGYPAIVPGYYGETTIFSHHIYRVRPKSESNLTSQFIYYLLIQPNIRDQVVGCCNGTTVNMLKVDGLQRPLFILPPVELIKKFSELVQGIWQRKETNFIANQTLTQIRDTLLPKLMTGKIKIA